MKCKNLASLPVATFVSRLFSLFGRHATRPPRLGIDRAREKDL